jgi:predicted dehydrogenase
MTRTQAARLTLRPAASAVNRTAAAPKRAIPSKPRLQGVPTELHAWRDPDAEVRVFVSEWLCTEPIDGQFLEYPRSARLVWNYLLRVGVSGVINKIRSRLAESRRNLKVTGLGLGTVLEGPPFRGALIGQPVLFFATNHDARHSTVVLHHELVFALPQQARPTATPSRQHDYPASLALWRAWSPFSGVPIDGTAIQGILAPIAAHLQHERPAPTQVQCHYAAIFRPAEVAGEATGRPTAVLFGLGNYAKTALLPNIRSRIAVQRIHEIDPEQLRFLEHRRDVDLCTSPWPHDERKFDVWFLAGFHHTHAALAQAALDQGSVAVIEKPLAVTRQQYDAFVSRLSVNPKSRFYVCFHKRYSLLHDFVHADLGSQPGVPIDMHCIVYEIPLPPHHWYNWPKSGSRLISNGCHWIDYFMYVNDYAPVAEVRKWQPKGKDLVVQMRLDNGAYLSMSLTDTGSQRLGVRDHIELRHGGTTISMTDGARYLAENRQRIIRRARCNPLSAYARMYRKIARAISEDCGGDEVKTLRSAEATLRLEEL